MFALADAYSRHGAQSLAIQTARELLERTSDQRLRHRTLRFLAAIYRKAGREREASHAEAQAIKVERSMRP